MYVMEKSDHPLEDMAEAQRRTRALQDHVRVVFAQQLFHKIRDKRVGVVAPRDLFVYQLLEDRNLLVPQQATSKLVNDPQWDDQWYMVRRRVIIRFVPSLRKDEAAFC